MKNYLKLVGILAVIAVTLTSAWVFLLPLFGVGKIVGREAQKFDAETSAQVYDTSRQYRQGINRDIARYCREWRSAEGPAQLAVAELINSTLDTYEGTLTPANQSCIQEIEQ